MRKIDPPHAGVSDACDRLFAEARGHDRWPRGSSEKLNYRLLSRAAYPDVPPDALVRGVNAGDQQAIHTAIEWLRFDPFCLWSGYAKQRLMRALAKTKLSTSQASKVRELLLANLLKGRREEFRESCRLARAVQDSDFVRRLSALLDHDDTDVAQRASWMLQRCNAPIQS